MQRKNGFALTPSVRIPGLDLVGASAALRPSMPSTEAIINQVMGTLCGPEHVGDALWRQGLVQMVIDHDDVPRPVREAAYLIRSPEAAELHMRRARGPAATNRASMEVINAVQNVLAYTEEMGWSVPG